RAPAGRGAGARLETPGGAGGPDRDSGAGREHGAGAGVGAGGRRNEHATAPVIVAASRGGAPGEREGRAMAVDMDKAMEFVGKVVGDLGATMAAGGIVVGHRLGLYRALAEGPAT